MRMGVWKRVGWTSGRAKREKLQQCSKKMPESQGQNLAVTVVYVPSSLDSALAAAVCGADFFFLITLEPEVERYKSL